MAEPCIRESNPFSVLTPEEVESLTLAKSIETFARGKYLFEAGESVRGIYCLSKGTVKITQKANRGRDLTLRFAAAGDWVGHRSIFTSDTFRGSAVAKESTQACFVPTETLFKFFASNRMFAHQLVRMIARDLERTERKLLEYQNLNVASRLISMFRTLDEKFGMKSEAGRHLSIRLSKVEIAELIGASEEVVSRQLSKWKTESLLRENGKTFFLSDRLLERVIREQ